MKIRANDIRSTDDKLSVSQSLTSHLAEDLRMKAVVQDTYGESEVLEFRDVPKPSVENDNDVLIRVHAAGVDAGVWHLMTGLPYLVRLAGYGVRSPKHPIRGMDMAGRVEAVGTNVTEFQVGDEVFGLANGSFAEFVIAKEAKLVLKPANLSFEQAAAVPTSALTALQAVRDHGQVKPGQRVLIVGASGGVGSFAVQIANTFGADVTGVARTAKLDAVLSIGADHVIDYTQEDFTTMDERYDIIVDTGGLRSIASLRGVLTPHGTLVIVGGEGGNKWTGAAGRGLRAIALSPFVGHNLRNFIASTKKEDLLTLRELAESGKVTPVIDKTFPLHEAVSAIQYLADGHATGKLVITINPDPTKPGPRAITLVEETASGTTR